jgi:hypothetical protein
MRDSGIAPSASTGSCPNTITSQCPCAGAVGTIDAGAVDEANTGEVDRVIWERFLDETGLVDVCAELSCDEPQSIDKFAYRSSPTVQLTPSELTFPRARFTSPAGKPLSDHPPVVVRWSWDVPGT